MSRMPDLIQENTEGWSQALRSPNVAVRPAANIWSLLEYACHVRDVHLLFDERLHLMLSEENPTFANWDQDVTAVEHAYAEQDPHTVELALIEATATVAGRYASISGEERSRPGSRSNGSGFTVDTLGRYHLHDVVHHLYDVRRGTGRNQR